MRRRAKEDCGRTKRLTVVGKLKAELRRRLIEGERAGKSDGVWPDRPQKVIKGINPKPAGTKPSPPPAPPPKRPVRLLVELQRSLTHENRAPTTRPPVGETGKCDPIRELADKLEEATGFRPTTFVATYPLGVELKRQIEMSPCLGPYRVDLEAGIITFEVLPP